MKSPILFLVFNRPSVTERVFEEIRNARPSLLYIACDGPRPHKNGEAKLVENVQEICSKVDWPCTVRTLYRDSNLGSMLAVSSAISWFFDHEECGIILEDDCLPSQSFFQFCDEMLEKHRENHRVQLVAGYNKLQTWRHSEFDYFYSHLGAIWGWASWRRAWKNYDIGMKLLEEKIEEGFFVDLLGKKVGSIRQKQLLAAKKSILHGDIDAWDYQWGYTRHVNYGIACMPARSLIRNIGFGPDATHTTSGSDSVVEESLAFPLRENNDLTPDPDFDLRLLKSRPLLFRILDKVKVLLP